MLLRSRNRPTGYEMAGSSQPLVSPSDFADAALPAPQKGLLRLAPTLLDCLFFSLIVWLFLAGPSGWLALLADGDTGWHIRTGELILNTHALPRVDPYSFSRPGAQWFAWEWLSEVLFAVLFHLAGLKAVVLFAGIVIPLGATVMFRHMLWRGATPLIALPLILVSTGASSIHYLARPHVITLLFLAIALFVIDVDRKQHSSRIYWLIPLTALWTNLHGGWVAIVACLGLIGVGSLLNGKREDFWRYCLLAAGCLAASLANPYGWHLHVHMFDYLRSDWIRNAVEEFQSPSFRSESMLHFEGLLILGVISAGMAAMQKRWADALLIVFWVHMSLGSVRHVPVYMMVAGPIVAAEVTNWWRALLEGRSRRSVLRTLDELSADLYPKFCNASVWILVPAIVLGVLNDPVKWPKDFPAEKMPLAMIGKHTSQIQGKRVLAPDEWGDYLIYKFFPVQRVFFDGRSDFFGPEVGKDYVCLMQAGENWETVFQKYNFDAAFIPPSWPLASILKRYPGWTLAGEDKQAMLFVRSVPGPDSETGKKPQAGLMKNNFPAESTTGEGIDMKTARAAASKQGTRSSVAEWASAETSIAASFWRLPSGMALTDFALQAGFLAPQLLKHSALPPESNGRQRRHAERRSS
jgi:hypothetical protein